MPARAAPCRSIRAISAARLLLARSRSPRRRSSAAETFEIEAALDAHPEYPDLHYWLGLARFLAGEPRRARRARARDRPQPLVRAGESPAGARPPRRRGTRGGAAPAAAGVRAGPREPRARDGSRGPDLRPPSTRRRRGALQPRGGAAADYPDLHLDLARGSSGRAALRRVAAARLPIALALQPGYAAARIELARLELERGPRGAAEPLLARRGGAHPRWADAQGTAGPRAGAPRRRSRRRREGAARGAALNPSYAEARGELDAAWCA